MAWHSIYSMRNRALRRRHRLYYYICGTVCDAGYGYDMIYDATAPRSLLLVVRAHVQQGMFCFICSTLQLCFSLALLAILHSNYLLVALCTCTVVFTFVCMRILICPTIMSAPHSQTHSAKYPPYVKKLTESNSNCWTRLYVLFPFESL